MQVLIYGGGKLGCQVAHLMASHFGDSYNVRGFVDDVQPPDTEIVGGLRTVGSLQDVAAMDHFAVDKILLVFAIGYSNMSGRRLAYENAKTNKYLITITDKFLIRKHYFIFIITEFIFLNHSKRGR